MAKILSIIIPIYQTEAYIRRCLDSLVIEDVELMNLLEVILVNNASEDNAPAIAHEYAKRYPDVFKEISIYPNRKHGGACNNGISVATGKYIRILDSDDWLANLDVLLRKLQNTDADLVLTHVNNYYAHEKINIVRLIKDEYGINKSISSFNFEDNCFPDVVNFWHTTYKSEILRFNEPLFSETVGYSDIVLFTAPFIKAKTYICYDFVLYNYFIGREDQSLNKQNTTSGIRNLYASCMYAVEFLQKYENELNDHLKYEVRNILLWWPKRLAFKVLCLPYNESKIAFNTLVQLLKRNNEELTAKRWKLYTKLPFFLVYIIENIRTR